MKVQHIFSTAFLCGILSIASTSYAQCSDKEYVIFKKYNYSEDELQERMDEISWKISFRKKIDGTIKNKFTKVVAEIVK